MPSKLVEVMEFQLSYFKSWKTMLWKCSLNMPANLENSAVATGLEKVSFHSNPKNASKVMLKILQVRLQQYVNCELPDVQAGFRKGRGICSIMEKPREFQKNTYFCFIDYTKASNYVDHNKLWKIRKKWDYQTTLSPEKTVHR